MTEHCTSLKPGRKIYCIIPGPKGEKKALYPTAPKQLVILPVLTWDTKEYVNTVSCQGDSVHCILKPSEHRFLVFKTQACEVHEVNTIAPKRNIFHFSLQMEGFACPGLNSEECIVCSSEIFHDTGHHSDLLNKLVGIVNSHLAFMTKYLPHSKKSEFLTTYENMPCRPLYW